MSATAAAFAPDLRALPPDAWPEALTEFYKSGLPGVLGIEITALEPGCVEARLPLRDDLMQTAGGILHAGTIVAFADSLAGWGCLASLPDTASAFVTGELKANMVASTRQPDALTAVAIMVHGGRMTQVWDVTVARESDARALAHFRCTQHLVAGR
ncbi:1,4-dihydroxy-2-naphthoyl-CoA hydrolase [Baekduia alba]|uniref:PaaI family thioesterase n=1 Tax=Baekduia alba TaxID=2997333 RepID=UPI00233FCFD3|nr:PaaI family thioesterase [Baekduia alba]WCB96265.1 1,4-dihydroxy-2-naphthoyl-CoA hydrolase [Baekduia alba]